VVLCDLHMPGVSGWTSPNAWFKGKSGSRVIIVSVQVDGPMPRRLLDAGAFGTWASVATPPSC
jgi:DNA-binding NarL/FixJ family response regulator